VLDIRLDLSVDNAKKRVVPATPRLQNRLDAHVGSHRRISSRDGFGSSTV
jgi:hypothetical protein